MKKGESRQEIQGRHGRIVVVLPEKKPEREEVENFYGKVVSIWRASISRQRK